MESSYTSSTTKPIFRGTQIVWYILGMIETLLLFRFLLKVMNANPAAAFTSFIYGTTWPLAGPFVAVFNKSSVLGSVFEWTTLLAMLVYLIVAMGIVRLFLMSKTVSTPEAAAKLDGKEVS